jgi:hypothetical protein
MPRIAKPFLVLCGSAAFGVGAGTASAAPVVHGWSGPCRHGYPGVERTASTCGAKVVDGRAVAPASAPPVVRDVIEAANRIDGRPYVWGGGHLGWRDDGYDCSGAVSYALHGGDLLSTPLVSGTLAYWGEGGAGRWLTVYANNHHTFMVVAGLRFDTRDDPPGVNGPRWHEWMVDAHNFVARHPPGL